jgi:hypothetical protein
MEGRTMTITDLDLSTAYAAGKDAGTLNDDYVDRDPRLRARFVAGVLAARKIADYEWRQSIADRDAGYAATLPVDPPAWARDPEMVPDAPRVIAPVPDPYTTRVHEMRADGTVGKRGRAHVVGNTVWTSPLDTVVGPREALASYLLRIGKRNTLGQCSTIELSRAADAVLGSKALPALIGTDVMSWQEVVHADETSTSDATWHNATDPYDAARQCGYGPDLDQLARAHVTYRVKSYRPRFAGVRIPRAYGIAHADTGADIADTARRDSVTVRPIVKRDTRERLPKPRLRKSERDAYRPLATAPAYCHAFGVVALAGPTGRADAEPGFIGPPLPVVRVGHRLMTRGATHAVKRATTRATVKRAATIELADADAVARHAAALVPGARIRWTIGAVSGTLARAETGSYSVRVKRDDGRTVTRSSLRAPRYVASVIRNAVK